MENNFSTYHPSQKKAILKYFENNKDKINESARERYKKRMENPEYREKYNARMREYYMKKKIKNIKENYILDCLNKNN